MLFPAMNKANPVVFNAKRQPKAIVDFLKAYSSTTFTLPEDADLSSVHQSEEVLPEDTTGPVTVVKGKTFNQIVLESDKDVFVKFYVPWCGHCKTMAPDWEKLGNEIKAMGIDKTLTIAQIDMTANECDVEVSGYPTLKLFPRGKKDSPVEFPGSERQVKDLLQFLKKHATKPITITNPDYLATYKSEEVLPEDTAGPVKVVKGKSFENIVLDSGKDVFVKVYAPWCGWCKKVAPEWEKLGSAFEDIDTVTIAKIDATANEAEGLKANGFPTFLFYPANDKTPIAFKGERTVADFAAFIKKHASTPFTLDLPEPKPVELKSEEVLPEDTAGPVKVVKGKSFKDLVLDSGKDVFVKVYAPWCGWCKKVAPEWEKLGSAFEDIDTVTIAKIDATANEAEGLKANGFPTFLFYPANDKTPIAFKGERTVADFAAFIKKHASTPFTLDLTQEDEGSAKDEL